jgi:hypothetical protein
VVREHDGSSGDSAIENVNRQQLDPMAEARAVQAMLDDGYTLAGAAQALGWSTQLVSARAKLLALPEAAQQLVGAGEIPVSAVENLLELRAVSEPLADAAVQSIASGDYAGAELARNPAWAIQQTLQCAPKGVFAETLSTVQIHTLGRLRLGKKITALVTEAEALHKQVESYAYGPPSFRFAETDVDQARAAGVLVEFAESHRPPIVTDQGVYRELVKNVITRTVEDLRARAAAKATGKRGGAAKRQRSPRDELDTEHRANLRDLTVRAHGSNLDLGAALMSELAVVDPSDFDVVKFVCYGLLGPDSASYLGTSDHAARTIAANGLALVLEEHRTTKTPRLKSGKPGKTKIAYADVEDVTKALWRFVDSASNAGELLGRVLVVYAAQHYAHQLVLATSKRRPSVLPRSHKDIARKAFERATKKVLPASHKALAKALEAEAKSYQAQIAALEKRARASVSPAAVTQPAAPRKGEDVDELAAVSGDEDLDPDFAGDDEDALDYDDPTDDATGAE